MSKTIKCPECSDDVFPEFGMCPTCLHKFKSSEYRSQGLREEDFTGIEEIKMSPSRFFGYLKIIAFIIVLFIVLAKIFSR